MSQSFGAVDNNRRLGRLRLIARRVRQTAHTFGIEFSSVRTEDRRVLETVILPALGQDRDLQTVLFVGCAWYTQKYERAFAGKDYWTLEIDPTLRPYGSRQHVTDSLAEVRQHFAPQSLDLIVCNGVLGWGLNDKADIEKAFAGCYESLRGGGLLVLGWNDVGPHRPYPMESYAWIRMFRPYVFGPLGAHRYETGTENHHIFSFFVK